MIVAAIILTLSAAMFFFYFQNTCQMALRRQFEREYFQSIAEVMRLEFSAVRRSLDDPYASVDYSRLSKALRADLLALRHVLQNTARLDEGPSLKDRLLILYFRCQLISFAVRRFIKVDEKRAILRLTSVLQYFGNLAGQRFCIAARFSMSTASDYLPNS